MKKFVKTTKVIFSYAGMFGIGVFTCCLIKCNISTIDAIFGLIISIPVAILPFFSTIEDEELEKKW